MSRLLLKLYPEAWRRRYETEMSVLLEDDPPGPVSQFDLIRGALRAHLHTLPGRSPLERARGSVSGVLGAFICFCFVGSAFAKTTEDQPFQVAGREHALLGAAHYAVLIAALLGAALLACAALPLAWRAAAEARRTRNRELVRLIAIPPVAIVLWIGSLGVLGVWVSTHQHRADTVAWLLLALCAVVTVLAAFWCWRAPRAILRRVDAGRGALAISLRALSGVAVCMWAVSAGTAIYLATILTEAPSLAASADGPGGISVTDVDIAMQLVAMLVLSAMAALSARRGSRALSAR
jgi:magnesium-transporting ATPase (P-type)